MITLKRKEAFARAVAAFGQWNTWTREQHIAYGLIRGVPYAAMERCSNDNPSQYGIAFRLWELGAWPENPMPKPDPKRFISLPGSFHQEVIDLVRWVRKIPRPKRPHFPGTLVQRTLEDVAP